MYSGLNVNAWYLQNTFGDIYIPDEFEPPASQKISELSRRSHDVSSGAVQIINAKTILLPELTYDGKGKGIESVWRS